MSATIYIVSKTASRTYTNEVVEVDGFVAVSLDLTILLDITRDQAYIEGHHLDLAS